MTSTDRLAEMAAEISRLHTKIVGLEAIVADNEARVANTYGMAAEIERLRARVAELSAFIVAMPTDDATELRLSNALARITELEGNLTVTFGTLAPPPDPADMPTIYSHDVKPSAPPNDEPQPPIGHTIKWPTRTGDDNE